MESLGKKVLNWVCVAFLFTVPLFYDAMRTGNLAPRDQQWMCYAVFGVLVLAALIRNIWVSLFLLLSLAHSFFMPNEFSESQLYMVGVCALVYYAFQTINARHYKTALIAFTFVNALITFTRLMKPEILIYFKEIPNGMLGTAALITPVIATISPLFWPLGAIMVILGKSLIPVLAFLAAGGFVMWHFKRKLFYWVMPLLVIAMLAGVHLNRDKGHMHESMRRTHVWQMVISKTLLSPWMGIGMGSMKQQRIMEYHKEGKPREYVQFKLCPENKAAVDESIKKHQDYTIYIWDNPHSEYLYVFFEYGILGLIIVSGFIWSMFSRFRRWRAALDIQNQRWKSNIDCALDGEVIGLMAAFIALLIFSSGHFPFYLARMNCIAVALVAMLDRRLE